MTGPPAAGVRSGRSTPDAPSPLRARIERIVVRAHGDAATGARLAELLPARLPARLESLLSEHLVTDERALRAVVERAVREAAR
jgi:hypothetical protein